MGRYEDVIARVERALGIRLDHPTLLRTRRAVSGRSDRGTWVSIQARPVDRVIRHGWGGAAAAGALTGVSRPGWYRSVAWADPNRAVWWRADESELVSAAAIKPAGTITVHPRLSQGWWAKLRASLAALCGQPASRVATLGSASSEFTTRQDHQNYIGSLVGKAAGAAGVAVDATITQWATAHANLTWANLTAPHCWLLGWEDWGTAPRGLDPATLLVASLAVPTLTDRIRREFTTDLNSRSGQLVRLALCTELTSRPGRGGVLHEPARRETRALLDTLTR